MIKPILFMLLIASILFNSCRKTTLQSELIVDEVGLSIEGKFFATHRSEDPEENAIVEFVKRKNNKKPFVEATIKQIGYPRWDKAIKSKKATKSSTIKVSSISRTNNVVSAQSSFDIYYVPFVRDSQNFVNASMVIKASPTDTSISYLCDWQYRNKTHGSPDVPATAEKYALFFMMLDNHTLGHTDFNITDLDLFPEVKSSEGAKKVGILNQADQIESGIRSHVYTEVCLRFYICGSPGWCADHGGCDYLNCISSPAICYLKSSYCGGTWDPGGEDGGDVGGSSGGDDGDNGGGTGGSTPPPPCGQGPVTIEGKTPKNNSGVTTHTMPCNPRPGWTPVVVDANSAVSYIEMLMPLTVDQVNWLTEQPSDALDIALSLADEDLITPEVIAATHITVDLAVAHVLNDPNNSLYGNIVDGHIPVTYLGVHVNLIRYNSYVFAQMAMLKSEHPDWGVPHLYWAASLGAIQLGLDILGLFPIVGEVADVVNGMIYSIQGDGTLAILSYASAMPVIGWWAFGEKIAKRTIVSTTGKSILTWTRLTSDRVLFSNRGQLRKVLGITAKTKQAHHIVPWEFINNDVVQMAAKGGNPFHMNDLINGIPLDKSIHVEGIVHTAYNDRIQIKLNAIATQFGNNLNPDNARTALETLISQIRTEILNNPGVNLNNLIF